jgi:hypothetical protein
MVDNSPASGIPVRTSKVHRFLAIQVAASAVVFACLVMCVVCKLHACRFVWGGIGGAYTHELSLSGGELFYGATDDWPNGAPARAWPGEESCDIDIDVHIARWFRCRESWYPDGWDRGLSPAERLRLPHFFHFRRGLRINVLDVMLIAACPALVCVAINLRLIFPRQRRQGFCQVCGYDLRATPERCPECGTKPHIEVAASRKV